LKRTSIFILTILAPLFFVEQTSSFAQKPRRRPVTPARWAKVALDRMLAIQ
jgi:hypothetical protein